MPMLPEAAYILNRRAYKESSLMLDVLTLNYGRISVIAKGALKSKKSWSALLQVFQPLLIVWAGRSSLKTLTSVEAPSDTPILSTISTLSGRHLFSAYYLNELILKLTPQEQGSAISVNASAYFLSYSNALADLAICTNIEHPLRIFEYKLLSELGVFPDSYQDVYGVEIKVKSFYTLVLQEGFKPVDNLDLISPDSVYINGSYLLNLPQMIEEGFEFDNTFLKQIKRVMRILINELLNGQPLKSRSLFQSYKPYRSV